MKYFLIIIGIIAIGIFIGYKYINYKLISFQEETYKEFGGQSFNESARTFPDSVRMDDTQFWGLIDESKVKHPGNFDAQMDFLTNRVSTLTNKEIIGFEATLKEKVIGLWDYKIKSVYQILFGEYLSTDGFLYFRFWIVSNGKDFYKTVLINPDQLADIMQASNDGERLMTIADDAFELKNGKSSGLDLPRDITEQMSYDFGNYRMSGKYIPLNEFKAQFPRLVEKF